MGVLQNLRQKGTTNFVKVTFKEPLEIEWLNRLNGVIVVNKLDTYSWQIKSSDANEVKKQLLEMSLQHNLNIVSLQTEGGSLEEIFRRLTSAAK